MDKFLIFKKLIQKHTEVGFLRTVFGWLAKILAIVIVVYGVIEFIDRWSGLGEKIEHILATIILQVIWLLILYLLFHVWWMKGEIIHGLKDKDYVLTPVVQTYLRGIGESVAIYSILMGVAYMFWCLFTNVYGIGIPEVPTLIAFATESSFLWGLILLVNGVLYGVIALGLFYFFAEFIGFFLDVARNTKKK